MHEVSEPVRPSRVAAERAALLVRLCLDLDRRGAPPAARLAALDQARAAVATVPPGRIRDRLATVCDILTDLHRDDTAEAVRAAIVRARAALGQPAAG
ncbi:hypothetical protein GCM10010472_45330 [Pseudonocardia halophobica]|uniref:Uncharacterized protein n=1 Tax=Pseudonocardia halophobica TaxID=29401 RepID=A0A9W6L5Y9_9PSEU|nr:hypothetical protein [Pseudonocardia halophobica]GLL13868.1 hypothetical protein GCM10017577_50130 [Pseudonocardia halophobica]